jgi:hypothetical protein
MIVAAVSTGLATGLARANDDSVQLEEEAIATKPAESSQTAPVAVTGLTAQRTGARQCP